MKRPAGWSRQAYAWAYRGALWAPWLILVIVLFVPSAWPLWVIGFVLLLLPFLWGRRVPRQTIQSEGARAPGPGD